MVQRFNYGLIFVVSAMCSACQSYYADSAILEHQKIIIDSYSLEHASRHGPGIVVTMKQDEAIRVKAPRSQEFKKLLEDQLAIERLQGRNYCPFGYEIKTMTHFAHSHTTIEINCIPPKAD